MSNPMTSREGNSPAQMGGPDIAKIAASLTKAQREALLECDWHGSGATQFATVPVLGRSFLPANLAHMFTLHSDRLTDLGLAVRVYLLKEPIA